jgi:hypothetical protein
MTRVRVVDHVPGERDLIDDWRALPENERMEFKRAIAERAALHRDETIGFVPSVIVRMVPLVEA